MFSFSDIENYFILNPNSLLFWIGLFGLILGSFLNVVIYRLPKIIENQWKKEAYAFHLNELNEGSDEVFNLSLPLSHCPNCKTHIKFYDNIPVISWLILKGKCRHCHCKIKSRYPLVELSSMLLGIVCAYQFGPSLTMLAYFILSLTLLTLAIIDFDTYLLPDQITIPMIWLGLIFATSTNAPINLEESLFGAVAGYISLWSVYWIFKLITKKEGMGYGDFKLLALSGAWLGWQILPIVLLIAALLGLLYGIINLRKTNKHLNTAIPFGPFLSLATWVCLIWGQQISSFYFNLA